MCIISKIQRRLLSKTQSKIANVNEPKEVSEKRTTPELWCHVRGKGIVVDKTEEKNITMKVLIILAT